jgi:hypothetical protein
MLFSPTVIEVRIRSIKRTWDYGWRWSSNFSWSLGELDHNWSLKSRSDVSLALGSGDSFDFRGFCDAHHFPSGTDRVNLFSHPIHGVRTLEDLHVDPKRSFLAGLEFWDPAE